MEQDVVAPDRFVQQISTSSDVRPVHVDTHFHTKDSGVSRNLITNLSDSRSC